MTLSVLESHSPIASFFKCDILYLYCLVRSFCISRAFCYANSEKFTNEDGDTY